MIVEVPVHESRDLSYNKKGDTVRILWGRYSVTDKATRYWLDGPGIESRWRRDFSHPSTLALGPNQPPIL
jgi:hypothetical protein